MPPPGPGPRVSDSRTPRTLRVSGVTGQALRLRVYSVISYFLAPGATVARRIVTLLHTCTQLAAGAALSPFGRRWRFSTLNSQLQMNSTQWFLFPAQVLWGGSLNRSPACKVGTFAPCQEHPSRACVRYEAIKVGATHQSIDHDSGPTDSVLVYRRSGRSTCIQRSKFV